MTTGVLCPVPILQFFDNTGKPAVGGSVLTQVGGVNAATYSDVNLTTPLPNPIPLNSRGEASTAAGATAQVFLTPNTIYVFTISDAAGNVLDTPQYVDGIQLQITQAFIGALLYPQTGAEIAASVTPTNYAYPSGNLLRYGADPTGIASSWTAFTNAAAVCQKTGLALTVPAGEYLIDTSNGTITLQYVTINGSGANDNNNVDSQGSVLNITGTSNTPFKVQAGVTFNGIVFYYPNQVTDGVTPTVYPLTLTFDHTNGAVNYVYIQNCTVINAYRFLGDANSAGGLGHIFILDNTIYGILTCIEIAYNDEIITVSGNEFTFGAFNVAQLETNPSFRYFTRNNGSALLINRSDGITITDNYFFAYKYGIQYPITTGDVVQQTQILGNGFDQTQYGISASGSGLFTFTDIVGNLLTGYDNITDTNIGNAIAISTSGTGREQINILSNTFSVASGDAILVSGNTPGRFYNIVGNTFTQWGSFQTTGTYSAINAGGTNTSFLCSGNTFSSAATAGCTTTGIRGAGAAAVISNNIFSSCGVAALGVGGTALTYSQLVITANFSNAGVGGTYDDNVSATTLYEIGNQWGRPSHGTTYIVPLAAWTQAANDAAAAAAVPPVPIGGLYYNTNVNAVVVRLT